MSTMPTALPISYSKMLWWQLWAWIVTKLWREPKCLKLMGLCLKFDYKWAIFWKLKMRLYLWITNMRFSWERMKHISWMDIKGKRISKLQSISKIKLSQLLMKNWESTSISTCRTVWNMFMRLALPSLPPMRIYSYRIWPTTLSRNLY